MDRHPAAGFRGPRQGPGAAEPPSKEVSAQEEAGREEQTKNLARLGTTHSLAAVNPACSLTTRNATGQGLALWQSCVQTLAATELRSKTIWCHCCKCFHS